MLYGRPVRFLALVATGWLSWRAFMLWPDAPTAQLLELPRDLIKAGWVGEAHAAPIDIAEARPNRSMTITALRDAPSEPPSPARDIDRLPFAYAALTHFSTRFVADDVELGRLGDKAMTQIAAVPPLSLRRATDRWQASTWLVIRGGAAAGTRQLGGSQAGLVVRHTLTDRIGGYARATAPLSGIGSELALGMDLRPGDAPVRLIAEHRFGLDGIEGGPAVGAVAGIGPQPAVAARPDIGVDVEAYGQAGVIWRTRAEPYGDGFVRVSRNVADERGAKLDIGVGAWAAAQRDVQRVDIGPSVGVRMPVGSRQLRASIDWRERVAGDVRPGSGMALTLAADF
ncbi:hypothetical protein [Sphingomonas sp. AX6]|uniref:hypothetical protein n=1 Tax=Sphingomonas sp. AX6 TaxID=2653171 RepID=UPI0012F29DDA|nr:hypothetical protein [Sphingomonas sp. AX6]VXC66665.1 conserved hypothetical protein [Sphingomonas sp. AX6]